MPGAFANGDKARVRVIKVDPSGKVDLDMREVRRLRCDGK